MVGMMDCLVTNPDVLFTDVEGEVVMIDVQSGQFYNLNEVGSHIWREMAEPIAAHALCQRLAQIYDAPCAHIESSVLRFLDEMLARDIVRIAA